MLLKDPGPSLKAGWRGVCEGFHVSHLKLNSESTKQIIDYSWEICLQEVADLKNPYWDPLLSKAW